MKYTFKEFQKQFPDDAACLAKLMDVNYGGTKTACPTCRSGVAQPRSTAIREAPSEASRSWASVSTNCAANEGSASSAAAMR